MVRDLDSLHEFVSSNFKTIDVPKKILGNIIWMHYINMSVVSVKVYVYQNKIKNYLYERNIIFNLQVIYK